MALLLKQLTLFHVSKNGPVSLRSVEVRIDATSNPLYVSYFCRHGFDSHSWPFL